MSSYIEHIQPFLENIQPLTLKPTGAKAEYANTDEIKAIVFDIYGTLIISASGDIMQDSYDAKMFQEALQSSGYELLVTSEDLLKIHEIFSAEVTLAKKNAKNSGIPFPELNIVSVWDQTLQKAEKKALIKATEKSDVRLFTFIFEMKSNQVWPMPGLLSTINKLQEKGYPLGIVSNAQFYTPVIMNYFLHNKITDKEFLEGFEPDLSVFSYKLLKGKPDVAIYEELLPAIKKRGLQPEEVLFVGNDMLKDIYAASQIGLKTCFFAGDERAYRLRKDHPQASKIKPDYTITELDQLLKFL